jgi:lipoate-protein ligase A
MRWHLLLTPPLPGADNMAIDEALMSRARRTGEGVVRVYSWARPTLSLGRNQHARGAYRAERARAAGVDIVRRATGGRALLHHREITYSVTAPVEPSDTLTRSYAAINQALREALRALAVPVEIAPGAGRLPPPGSAPCFELPARGELTLGGRKLVGSAQCREGGAMLQHGSILVHDDQAMIAQLSVAPVDIPPTATLWQALGRAPAPGEFAEALFAVVRRDWDAAAGALDPTVVGVRGAATGDEVAPDATCDPRLEDDLGAARARFLDPAWTWRR